MTMTPDEIMEHSANLSELMTIKRHQLSHMKMDSIARKRHELAITALEGRVRELAQAASALRGAPTAPLRGDAPTLQLVRPCPGVPPLADMGGEPEPVSDLPAASRDLCA